MEQYRQITFKQAMEMIADDKLDNLYFKAPDGITCVKTWQIKVSILKNETWYVKEQIK